MSEEDERMEALRTEIAEVKAEILELKAQMANTADEGLKKLVLENLAAVRREVATKEERLTALISKPQGVFQSTISHLMMGFFVED